VAIEDTKNCYAGVDLGGTKIALAIGASSGRIYAKASCDTHAQRGPEKVINTILDMLSRLDASFGVSARSIWRDVYLLNDARMATLGEQVFGQSRADSRPFRRGGRNRPPNDEAGWPSLPLWK
jgi:predicted NBD/HSP70 family sugar kinase